MSLIKTNTNPNRKFCYTYWCYCDWFDECQKNKSKKKTGGSEHDGGHDWEEEEHTLRMPDPDRAVERIEDEEHREVEERRPPQNMRYEVDVKYEDDDVDEEEVYSRRADRDGEDDEHDMIGRRDEEEEYSDESMHSGQPYRHEKQTHVHEFESSTKLFEKGMDRHNHRIAGVTGEEIRVTGGHIHKVWTRTDFFDHFHVVSKLTGPAIPVDKHGKGKNKKHIHYIEGTTSVEDEHDHQFEFVTQIESPLLPLEEEKYR